MKLALVAIQLEIGPDVLASPDVYRRHLDDAAARAVADAGDAEMRLLVFPEIAGHLALYALAPAAARRAKTLRAALALSAARHPLDVLRGIAITRVLGPRHALLAALAPDGERLWRAVFGPLARRHAAYVVAGSHLRLADTGDVTNASFLFAPDGRLVATTDKANLMPGLEDGAPGGLGLARGDADQLPIVDTPAGRLCTLIGYDAFCEPHTPHERFVPLAPRIAARGGVAIVANPAANPSQGQREGPAAGLAAFARWAVIAHLIGRVLDLRFDGQSEIVDREHRLARAERADRGCHVCATVEASATRLG